MWLGEHTEAKYRIPGSEGITKAQAASFLFTTSKDPPNLYLHSSPRKWDRSRDSTLCLLWDLRLPRKFFLLRPDVRLLLAPSAHLKPCTKTANSSAAWKPFKYLQAGSNSCCHTLLAANIADGSTQFWNSLPWVPSSPWSFLSRWSFYTSLKK